jgi:hypothetical protein
MNDTIYVVYHACNELFKFEKTGETGKKKKKTEIVYLGVTDEVLAGANRFGKVISKLNNVIMVGPGDSQLWVCEFSFRQRRRQSSDRNSELEQSVLDLGASVAMQFAQGRRLALPKYSGCQGSHG